MDEDNETILNRITIAKDVDEAAGRKMGIFEPAKGGMNIMPMEAKKVKLRFLSGNKIQI